jgi:hypothetical protein
LLAGAEAAAGGVGVAGVRVLGIPKADKSVDKLLSLRFR